MFNTGADTLKGRALRHDPRIALCVDDEAPPFSFAALRGEARLSDDLAAMLPIATRIGGRYMGVDRAEEFGRRNAVPGECLVRVQIHRVVAERDVAA